MRDLPLPTMPIADLRPASCNGGHFTVLHDLPSMLTRLVLTWFGLAMKKRFVKLSD